MSDICHNGTLRYCGKNAEHNDNDINDKHDCLKENEHICNKHCKYKNVSRECGINCSLRYNHEILDQTECICLKSREEHLCSQKCELCQIERFCVFQHEHSGKHLCDNEHMCIAECQQDGICEIITTKNLSIRKSHFLEKNNELIEYEEKSLQTSRRLPCSIKIPPRKLNHEGMHKCQILVHKCGYKCQQCNRLCHLEKGHNSLHDCAHGHIENGKIYTEDDFAEIIYLKKNVDFKNDESADMFTCYQYCKEQGRGHIHIISSSRFSEQINNNLNAYIIQESIKKINDNLFGCKCDFFWKKILNYGFDEEFDPEQKISFNKCSARCSLCKVKNLYSYCELDLWHEPAKNSESDASNYWISKEGHKFSCKHPMACHTIFIVDKSGSMEYNDIEPSIQTIKNNKNFNNRFGKLIENMDNYIKKRKSMCPEDVFSVVSFSDSADTIFKNKSCDLNDNNFSFIEECMKKVGKCKGETEFYRGFAEAEHILTEIDRTKYKPVIILFSDGADQKTNETIEIVKRVSINKIYYIIYFYQFSL